MWKALDRIFWWLRSISITESKFSLSSGNNQNRSLSSSIHLQSNPFFSPQIKSALFGSHVMFRSDLIFLPSPILRQFLRQPTLTKRTCCQSFPKHKYSFVIFGLDFAELLFEVKARRRVVTKGDNDFLRRKCSYGAREMAAMRHHVCACEFDCYFGSRRFLRCMKIRDEPFSRTPELKNNNEKGWVCRGLFFYIYFIFNIL